MRENCHLTINHFECETTLNYQNISAENQATNFQIESQSAPPIQIKNEALAVNELTFYALLCLMGILFALILRFDFKIIRYLKHLIHLRVPPKIPCSNCIYFQNNPYVKCAVNPCKALKEEAVNCSDYQEKK